MITKTINDLKVGMRVTLNGNPFLKVVKISRFNIFILPTNYPSKPFKIPISEFINLTF